MIKTRAETMTRRQAARGTATASLAATAMLTGGCGGNEGDVVGHIPWALSAVSPDARTLTIAHEEPRCESEPGEVEVNESAGGVRITIS